MAQIWRPQPFEVLKHWVDTILDEASDDLTEWETNFISDIQIKILNKWPLTESQQDRLECIYADKTR